MTSEDFMNMISDYLEEAHKVGKFEKAVNSIQEIINSQIRVRKAMAEHELQTITKLYERISE